MNELSFLLQLVRYTYKGDTPWGYHQMSRTPSIPVFNANEPPAYTSVLQGASAKPAVKAILHDFPGYSGLSSFSTREADALDLAPPRTSSASYDARTGSEARPPLHAPIPGVTEAELEGFENIESPQGSIERTHS